MMFESLLIWTLMLPAQSQADQTLENHEIPVQSVVVSLIDDVNLTFGEAGVVESVQCRPGDQVRKGDLLARLDTKDAQLELRRIEAELQMAKLKASNDLSVQLSKKALSVAKTELSRALKANEKFPDTVSGSEIDRLQLRVDEAELQIQQAKLDVEYQKLQVYLKEAERDIVQRQIEKRQLRSPMDGVIVKCELHGGELARPEQPQCRVVNMDRIRVEGFVQASEPSVETGDKVLVLWGGEKDGIRNDISGRITFVDPEIDTITNQYKVWAEIDNRDAGLRPGYRPAMVILKREADKNSEEVSVQ